MGKFMPDKKFGMNIGLRTRNLYHNFSLCKKKCLGWLKFWSYHKGNAEVFAHIPSGFLPKLSIPNIKGF